MSSSSAKGATRERELVDRFKSAGWGALRIGASGSGGDADLPDVLAGKSVPNPYCVVEDGDIGVEIRQDNADLWAVELKSGKATTLYVDAGEVADLERFAGSLGARPLLGARFTFSGGEHYDKTATYLVPPDAARRTDTAYGLPVADIDERAYAVVRDGSVERV